MGDNATALRILALRAGSALTYAAVEKATAPGQISLAELNETYRLQRKFGPGTNGPAKNTKVYAVIGNPIGHSLSPVMHNAAFAACAVDALLLPFRVTRLPEFISAMKDFDIAGCSVTLPHKEAILRHLDECDALAADIGAVNTVVRRRGRLYGYNTDYLGVLRAMEKRMQLKGSRVLLLGAGGAARAAAFALVRAGAEVHVCSRREARARSLARSAGAIAIPHARLSKVRFDAIVNCTPVGMHPNGGSPLRSNELNARVVMDMVYRPRRTELLRQAERKGIKTISGVEMFVAQGAAQWELWTAERAPEQILRRAVNKALTSEESARA
jgi:3-dehydroquinate dehydratase/shikimate dehydrogenase